MKSIIFAFFLSLPFVYSQSAPSSDSRSFEEMNAAIEQMMKELNIPLDSAAFNNLFESGNSNSIFMIDTLDFSSFFNEDFSSFFNNMGSDSAGMQQFNQLFDQGLQMFQSFDDKQMEELLNSLDFSKLNEMMQGLDFQTLDGILRGFELQVPENYFDSLQNSQKNTIPQKDLKRI